MQSTEAIKYVPAPRGLKLLLEAGIDISRPTFYQGLGNGQIPSVRVGKKYFVREDLVRLMAGI
jgi:hypothetical protein